MEISLIGQIIMSVIGVGGIIAALVNVLKTYLTRKSSVSIEIHTADNQKISINAQDLRDSDLQRILAQIVNLDKKTSEKKEEK